MSKLGSVKPGFSTIHPAFVEPVIINPPPKIGRGGLQSVQNGYRDLAAVFVPLENTWRKNLYTNFIAFDGIDSIATILMVNFPHYVDLVAETKKIRLTNFLEKPKLLQQMSSVALVSNVTLIECQPMTQLEALAVGTPCLTSPLNLPGFEKSAYRRLTEVRYPDDIFSIRDCTNKILDMWVHDEETLLGVMAEYYDLCVEGMGRSYKEFLEL